MTPKKNVELTYRNNDRQQMTVILQDPLFMGVQYAKKA